MEQPVKTITIERRLDPEGNVTSETVTTTVTETVKKPEPPPTGFYV
jgi:hypothetical protein